MKKNNFLLFLFIILMALPVGKNAGATAIIDYPMVELRALDKSTARTKTLKVKVGETLQYGSLYIKAQACRKSDPLEKPESAAFLQIWEVPLHSDKSEWIFSGWMFASSPALSAMDHAVYDVWILDCLTDIKQEKTAPKDPETRADIKNEDKVIENEENKIED